MITLRNILVPIDFEQTSVHALAYGQELARRFNATLHVLHVVEDDFALEAGTEGRVSDFPQVQRDLEAIARARLTTLVKPGAATSSTTTAVGTSPATALAITRYAENAHIDLIVIVTHGRTGTSAALLGSVAETVVRASPCPVLMVKQKAHDFIVPDVGCVECPLG
jgi:nucleotide-binding universal stress UspA family protein